MSADPGPDGHAPTGRDTSRRLRPGPGQDPKLVEADQRARLRQAMAELVYEAGYPGVTVENLLSRAQVTRRTFYRLFEGKEDCFAAAYAAAADEAIRWTAVATRGSSVRAKLIERGLRAFSGGFVARPASAYLALLEPTTVSQAAGRRLHQTEEEFAELLRRRFSELEEPVALPMPVALGLISGIARVGRRRFDVGRPQSFEEDADELARWALNLSDVDALGRFLRRGPHPTQTVSRDAGGPPQIFGDDDRTLLINAGTRLASERGYEGLGVADIAVMAGLSKRRFEANFATVAECFSAAVELGTVAAVTQIRSAYDAGPPGLAGMGRALDALTRYLAANPEMGRLLFVDVLLPGRQVTRHGAGLLSVFAGLLRERLAKDGVVISEQGAEATVGATWGLIRHQVAAGETASLPRLAPVLTWFIVAPAGRRDQS